MSTLEYSANGALGFLVLVLITSLTWIISTLIHAVTEVKAAKYQSFSGQEVVEGFWLEDYTEWLIGNGIVHEGNTTDDLVASYVAEHGDSD
jgi:hypothetical protein